MQSIIALALFAATGTNALYLAVSNMDYGTATPAGVYNSPYCQVGRGNTIEDAQHAASRTVHATALLAGAHCDQLPYKHTNQVGGYWDDYGVVNYVEGNTHWWCNPGHGSSGYCDAGNGYVSN